MIRKLDVGRMFYNACLGELYSRYNSMIKSPAYQQSIGLSKEDKTRNSKLNELRRDYKIGEYDLHDFVAPMKRHFNSLDIHTAQKVATRCYDAFTDLLFGKADQIHFKKRGSFDSLESKTNSTGIRYRDGFLKWGRLEIPVEIKPKDDYAHECLSRKIKFCRILRKSVGSKDKFYLQLILDGLPPIKVDEYTGQIKHPIGSGKVGLDIGTQTLAISSKTDVKLIELAEGLDQKYSEIRRVQRAIDRSRRATNPENYSEDGTVKKGRLKWVRSKRYKKLLYRYRELNRLYTDKKKQSHNVLANFVLSLGDEIYVEKMNFKALVKRDKKSELNSKRKFKCKKQFGKSILRKSPSLFLAILERKLIYIGKSLGRVDTWKVKASQYCHLDDTYKKKPLGKRWNDFAEAKIQRDMYSAFLLMNVHPNLESINKEWCDSTFDNFKALHDVEVKRLNVLNNISSVGIKKAA
ncbi:MAG: transposase [Negativicutes bacterium]|nr:transposase [Negativicutes bacterium]